MDDVIFLIIDFFDHLAKKHAIQIKDLNLLRNFLEFFCNYFIFGNE